MPDITDRNDIILLVDTFYSHIKLDELLEPLFQQVDWANHLPVMYNFWSSMLFGDQSYKGDPFQKHIQIAIDSRHFNRWLKLFTQTVDAHFAGSNAEEIKSRAQSIAGIFQHKMGLLT